MMFYLGTHLPTFFRKTDVPLFISRRQLCKRKSFPRALGRWALDSGGFTELKLHGTWTVSPHQYVEEVRRYMDGVGKIDWAAQQDWMCEPFMLNKTGLTVDEHQDRTISNLLELRSIDPSLPIIPVLQGWHVDDYKKCVDKFYAAGIELHKEMVVGVGSVCRRQHTTSIRDLFKYLYEGGLHSLHGFGVKKQGLKLAHMYLRSSDSLAWSFGARVTGFHGTAKPCPYGKKNCAHCLHYALDWRQDIITMIENDTGPAQLELF